MNSFWMWFIWNISKIQHKQVLVFLAIATMYQKRMVNVKTLSKDELTNSKKKMNLKFLFAIFKKKCLLKISGSDKSDRKFWS